MSKSEQMTIENEEVANRPTGEVCLEDYRPPSWRIDEVFLDFALAAEATRVTALFHCQRQEPGAPLCLDCDASTVRLISFALWPEEAGRVIDFRWTENPGAQPVGKATVTERQVVVSGALPDRLWAVAEVDLVPKENTALSGLYESASGLFTQCEPEGFRRIVPFIDRPDVLARYRVRLSADASRYPVLLANGNPIAAGPLDGGRHFVVWDDPFPKPCYLFALVAADLVATETEVALADGRQALLQVWTAHAHRERAHWALACLKAALRWDEQRFGRVLDLDRYMVVAVDDFNMGAMENKGLNLFNAKCVLVSPETATDSDFANVESIIGHEYFHNWTGNRITCRDWFQLTLKEGLTVFRDQEFSADQLAASVPTPEAAAAARAVKRIEDVAALWAMQFPEDAGPMRHPIRPRSYRAIDNFYTATVYEKGAEVVRLLYTLLGKEGFRRGMDRYFAAYDGQAVTCEDFVAAMAEANGVDLSAFLHWYDAPGTPEVEVFWRWLGKGDEAVVELTLAQTLSGWDVTSKPLLIPVRLGWVGKQGQALSFRIIERDESQVAANETDQQRSISNDSSQEVAETVVILDRPLQRWYFHGLARADRPVPSLLRGFSAPVRLRWRTTSDGREPITDLLQRFAGDCDPFNRWQAGQALMGIAITTAAWEPGSGAGWFPEFLAAWQQALVDEALDAHYRMRLLLPPAEAVVHNDWPRPFDPVVLRKQLMTFWQIVARAANQLPLVELLNRHTPAGPYCYTPQTAGSRALAGLLLKWLAVGGASEVDDLLAARWAQAQSLTERLMVVDAALCHAKEGLAEHYLAAFAAHYEGEPLVLDKWLHRHATRWTWQGQRPAAVVEQVAALTHHPHFRWETPNRVYALILSLFAHNIAVVAATGDPGWALWQEAVGRLDGTNPLVAARLARTLEQAPFWAEPYRSVALAAVREMAAAARSSEVQEVVGRILAAC